MKFTFVHVSSLTYISFAEARLARSVLNLSEHHRRRSVLNIGGKIIEQGSRDGSGVLRRGTPVGSGGRSSPEAEKIIRNVFLVIFWHIYISR